MIRAVVIGHRDDGVKCNIGGALLRRFPDQGYAPVGVATTKGVRGPSGEFVPLKRCGDPDEVLKHLDLIAGKPDIVFIAVPPMDRGQVALKYKLHYLEQGVPVVSAEKRAMAFNTPKLIGHLPILGFDAMVGGNLRPISSSRKRRLRRDKVKVLMVANGTANFDLSDVQRGHALATAAEKSRIMGYAEPDDGSGDGPYKQITGEITGDIPAKTVVYHNLVCVSGEGPFITPDAIEVVPFTSEDLDAYTDGATRYRYFVEFNNTSKKPRFDGKAPGSFLLDTGEWRISGGFLNVPRGTFHGEWAPDGVDNAMLIEYMQGHNGPVKLAAPGAGWGPTTDTMFQNAAEVLNLPY